MARIARNTILALIALLFMAYVVVRLFFTEEAEAEFRRVASAYPVAYSSLMVVFGGLLIRGFYEKPEGERNGFDLLIAASLFIVGVITLWEAMS